jgi:hypothetical protein
MHIFLDDDKVPIKDLKAKAKEFFDEISPTKLRNLG